MATLPKLLFYGDCSSFGFTAPNVMMKQRGKGYQGIRATEAFEHKNTRSSNVVITKKNEKHFRLYQTPKRHYQIKMPRISKNLLMNQNFNVMPKL